MLSITLGGGLLGKMSVEGLSTFQNSLELVAKEIHNMNKVALYEGAKVVADSVKEALNNMPVRKAFALGTEDKPVYGATSFEKEQIIANYGIAKFRDSNFGVETALGFHGYVDSYSTRFNDRIPTGFLMQAIEYGTSFRTGTHTITNATKSIKSQVTNAIEKSLSEQIEKLV